LKLLIKDGAIMPTVTTLFRAGLFTRFALTAAAIAVPLSIAGAQDDTTGGEQEDAIEEIIVTGTAGGAELRKFDASFAITTTSADEISMYQPESTADLLKLVPGVWSESSGGVSGANVMVRGFPGGGDAPFLTLQVNGSPVYPPPTLSFLENTTLFRLDETVLRMEALRGGPNPVFSNGQPGLTTNFILREGSEETEGMAKYTTSDYDLRRFDGFISGEVADQLYYMIGGYVSSSPGIRDAQFNSDEGHQFTINLTKDLDNGTINVFHRSTDDFGTWYLPVALNVPGVDAGYNQLGTMNRQRQITYDNANDEDLNGDGNPDFPNGGDPDHPDPSEKTVNLGDGRGWDGSMSGGSVSFEILDGWDLTDRVSYTAGNADTLGLVPDGGAVQISALIADPTLDPTAVIVGPITGSVSGRAIANSEYIQRFGAWEVRKGIEAFTNDLSLARAWDRGTVTVGYYAATASVEEWWSLANRKYEVVQSGGEVVTGIACNDPTIDSCGGGDYDIDATGDATTNAVYAATTFDLMDRLTVDVGIRVENYQVNYSVDEGVNGLVNLTIDFDETETSWTAAANYLFTDSIGGFLRINQGGKMPDFDSFRDNRGAFANGNDLIQDIDQYELGGKWVTDSFSLYATGFFTKVTNTAFIALTGSGAGQLSTQESKGVEIDGVWASNGGFMVNLNATILDSEITAGDNEGNETERQPGWQLRLTPSYEFEFGDIEATAYGTISAVDDRWGERANTNLLQGYEKVDLGVLLRVNEAFTVQVAADNILDEDALTESDPRTATAPNGRYIMPRTFTLSVGYEF
jgi:outer membrane receptor protein involved in Fe transport